MTSFNLCEKVTTHLIKIRQKIILFLIQLLALKILLKSKFEVGARALTRSTLQKTWQNVVIKSAWSDFGNGLRQSALQSFIDIAIVFISKFF